MPPFQLSHHQPTVKIYMIKYSIWSSNWLKKHPHKNRIELWSSKANWAALLPVKRIKKFFYNGEKKLLNCLTNIRWVLASNGIQWFNHSRSRISPSNKRKKYLRIRSRRIQVTQQSCIEKHAMLLNAANKNSWIFINLSNPLKLRRTWVFGQRNMFVRAGMIMYTMNGC